MGGKVTMSIISEHQVGKIGDDWKYTVSAKVFNEGLKGSGSIDIKKHTLGNDVTQEPPGPPAPVEMPAGDGGGELMIRITLNATEVDFFKSDSGENTIDYRMHCPAPGEGPLEHEVDVSVGVRESPGFVENASVLTIKLKFVAECD